MSAIGRTEKFRLGGHVTGLTRNEESGTNGTKWEKRPSRPCLATDRQALRPALRIVGRTRLYALSDGSIFKNLLSA